jgi:hypothetical protein
MIEIIMCDDYFHHSSYELYIDKSLLHNAGRGVFTKSFIPKGSFIDYYYGTIIEYFNGSEYLFEIDNKVYMDARDLPRCYMAMINDAAYKPTSKRALQKFKEHNYVNNCDFIVNKEKKEIQVWSTMDILPGSELFISYGSGYWNL